MKTGFKKILTITLGASLSLSSLPVDVLAESGQESSLTHDLKGDLKNKVLKEGYIRGYEDGTLRPEKSVSREELAVILNRLVGDEKPKTKKCDYKDLKKDRWSYKAIESLGQQGIVKGYEDNSFKPLRDVTRAEAIAMLVRYSGADLEDREDLRDYGGHWAEREISTALSKGWIKGFEDGKIRPNDKIKRAESIAIINKVFKIEGTGDLEKIEGDLPEDLRKDSWYFKDCIAAMEVQESKLKEDPKDINTEEKSISISDSYCKPCEKETAILGDSKDKEENDKKIEEPILKEETDNSINSDKALKAKLKEFTLKLEKIESFPASIDANNMKTARDLISASHKEFYPLYSELGEVMDLELRTRADNALLKLKDLDLKIKELKKDIEKEIEDAKLLETKLKEFTLKLEKIESFPASIDVNNMDLARDLISASHKEFYPLYSELGEVMDLELRERADNALLKLKDLDLKIKELKKEIENAKALEAKLKEFTLKLEKIESFPASIDVNNMNLARDLISASHKEFYPLYSELGEVMDLELRTRADKALLKLKDLDLKIKELKKEIENAKALEAKLKEFTLKLEKIESFPANIDVNNMKTARDLISASHKEFYPLYSELGEAMDLELRTRADNALLKLKDLDLKIKELKKDIQNAKLLEAKLKEFTLKLEKIESFPANIDVNNMKIARDLISASHKEFYPLYSELGEAMDLELRTRADNALLKLKDLDLKIKELKKDIEKSRALEELIRASIAGADLEKMIELKDLYYRDRQLYVYVNKELIDELELAIEKLREEDLLRLEAMVEEIENYSSSVGEDNREDFRQLKKKYDQSYHPLYSKLYSKLSDEMRKRTENVHYKMSQLSSDAQHFDLYFEEAKKLESDIVLALEAGDIESLKAHKKHYEERLDCLERYIDRDLIMALEAALENLSISKEFKELEAYLKLVEDFDSQVSLENEDDYLALRKVYDQDYYPLYSKLYHELDQELKDRCYWAFYKMDNLRVSRGNLHYYEGFKKSLENELKKEVSSQETLAELVHTYEENKSILDSLDQELIEELYRRLDKN